MIALSNGKYFGLVERRVHVAGLHISTSTHDRSARVPRHYHERGYFCLVVRGGFEERWTSHAVRSRAGTVIWHSPGALHEDTFGHRETRCVNIELDAAWLSRVQAAAGHLPPWAASTSPAGYWMTRTITRELACADSLASFALEALVSALIAEICRTESSSAPRWLRAVTQRLQAEFLEPPSVRALARDAGVHRSTLARGFQKHVGETMAGYIRRLRIQWAREQLRLDPHTSLIDLALRAGFYDQSHFSRAFKRVTGRTPRDFARLL